MMVSKEVSAKKHGSIFLGVDAPNLNASRGQLTPERQAYFQHSTTPRVMVVLRWLHALALRQAMLPFTRLLVDAIGLCSCHES